MRTGIRATGHVALLENIRSKKAKIGIIGLGYVGLPLVIEFCRAGFKVTGFDVDKNKVLYNDPFVPVCRGHRHYLDIDMKSVDLTEKTLKDADVALLLMDHSAYEYAFIVRRSQRIIDTRNAFRKNGIKSRKINKA